MGHIIEYSQNAEEDLDNIVYYIEKTLLSPIAAKNMYNGIKRKNLILEQVPYLGRKFDEYNRVIYYKKYSIFYSINLDQVLIKRIIYSGRNNLNSYLD